MKCQRGDCRCLTRDDARELHQFADAFCRFMKAEEKGLQSTRTKAARSANDTSRKRQSGRG